MSIEDEAYVVKKMPIEHLCALPSPATVPPGTEMVCTGRVDSLSDATCGIRWVASSSFFTRRPKWREFDWAW